MFKQKIFLLIASMLLLTACGKDVQTATVHLSTPQETEEEQVYASYPDTEAKIDMGKDITIEIGRVLLRPIREKFIGRDDYAYLMIDVIIENNTDKYIEYPVGNAVLKTPEMVERESEGYTITDGNSWSTGQYGIVGLVPRERKSITLRWNIASHPEEMLDFLEDFQLHVKDKKEEDRLILKYIIDWDLK